MTRPPTPAVHISMMPRRALTGLVLIAPKRPQLDMYIQRAGDILRPQRAGTATTYKAAQFCHYPQHHSLRMEQLTVSIYSNIKFVQDLRS